MNPDIWIEISFKGHRKRRKLRSLLGPGATDFLIDLWIGCALSRPEGIVHDYDSLDIAMEAGWDGEPQAFVEALVQVGFLDILDDGTYVLHDWAEHQPFVVKTKEREERAPEVVSLYPEVSFWRFIKRKFPPLRTRRWCCDFLRKHPSLRIALRHRIMGLRGEESSRRNDRARIDRNRREKTVIYKPIFLWKEWAVWEFIERRGLPYPSPYDEGWERAGCVICPFICSPNMQQVMRNRQRWPGIYRAFEHAVTEWFLTRKAQGASLREQTPEEYIHNWYRGIAGSTMPGATVFAAGFAYRDDRPRPRERTRLRS